MFTIPMQITLICSACSLALLMIVPQTASPTISPLSRAISHHLFGCGDILHPRYHPASISSTNMFSKPSLLPLHRLFCE